MKIVVTGGTGFLGKHVVELLQKSNHQVTILSRTENQVIKSVVKTDYSLEKLTEQLVGQEAIIHLAAKRGSQGKKVEFQDNEELTQNLYDAAIANGIKNIVYSSTISVYTGDSTLPWSEEILPRPHLMYGVSKLTCEMIGNLYNDKYDMYIKNLRLAHLFGPNEKNNYMINLFFRKAFRKELLSLNTQSTAKREFLYIKDAAKALVNAIECKEIEGTFNIGSNITLTNQEVAEQINEIFKNKGNLIVNNPDQLDNSVSSFMDSQLSEKQLDFKPQYSFRRALKEIYDNLEEIEDVPTYY